MKHHGILRDTVTCEAKTRGDTWSTPGKFIVNTVVKKLPESISTIHTFSRQAAKYHATLY